MIRDGITYVDNTLLSDVARCSTKAVLRHIHGYTAKDESVRLQAGIAAHEALAEWARGKTTKECLRAFRKSYKAFAAEHDLVPEDRFLGAYSYENLRLILRYWLDAHPLDEQLFTIDPEAVEVGFTVPLDKRETVLLTGRADAAPVIHREHGGVYGLDHKTTGRISAQWSEKFRMDSQISGYTYGLTAASHHDVHGFIINAIEFSKLPGLDDPTRKCRVPDHGGVPYEECQHLHVKHEVIIIGRTSLQVKEWKRSALALASRYQQLVEDFSDLDRLGRVPQEGKFVGECSWCQFKDFCQASRPVEMLDRVLVKRPWKPFDV